MSTANSRINLEQEVEKDVSSIVIAYKFALGILELLVGFGILFFGNQVFVYYLKLTSSEFFDTPHDLLADFLQTIIPYIFNHKVYVVSLLILIGLVKIVSCIAYWMGKKWGKDLLVLLLLVFVPFDLSKLILHFSASESAYLILDVFVIFALTNFKPLSYFRLRLGQHRKKQ